jgi:hypothetical protein
LLAAQQLEIVMLLNFVMGQVPLVLQTKYDLQESHAVLVQEIVT